MGKSNNNNNNKKKDEVKKSAGGVDLRLVGLLTFVVAIVSIVSYNPGVTIEGFKREEIITKQATINNDAFERTVEIFESQGVKVEGWLYKPHKVANPPVVILAPGLGMQKHFGLETVAEAFVKKGMAALVFDFRHFGGSDGEPRNLIKVSQQISDYHAAIRHVTSLSGIDSSKIGLWGASFSGGHVFNVAIEQLTLRKNTNITCIVARAPHLDSLEVVSRGSFAVTFKRLVVALRDLILSFFGKDQYVPLIADSATLSAITVSDTNEYQKALGAKSGSFGWQNLVPARTFLEILLYRPYLYASSVTVPTLIVYASNDETVSASLVEHTAASMPRAELYKVEGSHWQTYTDKKVLETEANFLAKHLVNSN